MIGNLHYMSLFQKEVELPYLNFTANTAGSTIGIQKKGGSPQNILYYSLNDGASWVSYAAKESATMISLSKGQRICWKCNAQESYYPSESYAYRFKMSGSLRGAGNIMSLIDGVGETLVIPSSYGDCFRDLFKDCTSLTTAPSLPATTIKYRCYQGMFEGCTSLTTAPPELPATTLDTSCYQRMFQGCTALTVAPNISATTLASGCCLNMFYGCASLTTAPALPATTLASSCYSNMFQDCTSLTTAPSLPATVGKGDCYYSMFKGCTSLTTLPRVYITGTQSNTCRYMFEGCSSIRLSTTKTGAYQTAYPMPNLEGANSMDSMFTSTGGTFQGTPTRNTTYYTSNTVV